MNKAISPMQNTAVVIANAVANDAAEILALQKRAYDSEARLYNDWTIPPLTQTLEALMDEFANSVILKATHAGRIVGSVRARSQGITCEIGRLVVEPDMQGQGIGSRLLQNIEIRFDQISRFELFTGSRSEGNIRLYQRHGYAITRTRKLSPSISLVFMEKQFQPKLDRVVAASEATVGE